MIHHTSQQKAGAIFVEENNGDWILWDLGEKRATTFGSIVDHLMGFYQYDASSDVYRRYEGIGSWQELPEIMYIDRSDYYGNEQMLVVQGIPTGTNCGWGCFLDALVAAGGLIIPGPGKWVSVIGVWDFVSGFEVYYENSYKIVTYPGQSNP